MFFLNSLLLAPRRVNRRNNFNMFLTKTLCLTESGRQYTNLISRGQICFISSTRIGKPLRRINRKNNRIITRMIRTGLTINTMNSITTMIGLTLYQERALLGRARTRTRRSIRLPRPFNVTTNRMIICNSSINALTKRHIRV